MTLELLHDIIYYTLTRTSIPNHAGNIKDMKYALLDQYKYRIIEEVTYRESHTTLIKVILQVDQIHNHHLACLLTFLSFTILIC